MIRNQIQILIIITSLVQQPTHQQQLPTTCPLQTCSLLQCTNCTVGSTLPSSCPPNSRTQIANATSVTDCKCLEGYYGVVLSLNSSSCSACIAGTYSLLVDQPTISTCTPCPAGYACPNISASPVPCPAGSYSSSTMQTSVESCTPFPAGSYGNVTGESNPPSQWCSVGEYSIVIGATSADVCRRCPAGEYCLTVGTGPQPCASTSQNAHFLGPGTTPANCPWMCDKGFFLLNSSFCSQCPPNSWCAANMQYSCPLHSESPPATSSLTQCRCPAGFTGDDGSSCTRCAAGWYCEGGNLSSACPENSSSVGSSSRLMDCVCLPGYQGDDGTACSLCAPDVICASGVLSTCPANSKAPPGSSNASACVSVPGYYSLSEGGVPVICPGGFYCSGGLNISACPLHATSVPGSQDQTGCFCEDGYQQESSSSSCTPCPAATFCSSGVLNQCPPNSNSSEMSSVITDCKCNPGFQGSDGSVCTQCLPGKSKSTVGADLCVSCLLGETYAPVHGALECLRCSACPRWTVASCVVDQDAVCGECPANSWCENGVRTQCPPTTTSAVNSTSLFDCRCAEGMFGSVVNASLAVCESCPSGSFCPAEVVSVCLC